MSDHLSQSSLSTLLTPAFTVGTPVTVSGAATNAGLINLTATAHGIVQPTAPYTYLWGVVVKVGGTIEANGLWPLTVVDVNHITLVGSTFTNAYTSGGTLAVVTISAGLLSQTQATQIANIVNTLERCPASPGIVIGTTLAIAP